MKTYSSIKSLALFLVGTALLAGCGGGGGDSGTFFIPAPVAKAQLADTVIGQATFTSYSSLADPTYSRDVSAYTNDGSFGSPVVSSGGILYLPDTNANRVLGYNTVPTTNGAGASFVLGQSTFASYSTATGANNMGHPQSVRLSGSKLFVTDYKNNRILVWNTAPTTTGVPADLVVGQPGFGSTSDIPANSDLYNPEDMFVVGTKLIVADSGNNRVLIWNTIPTASGIPADIVLGQNSMSNIAANDNDQDGVPDAAPTSLSLNYPSGIWSDGTRLIVCDSLNNRVLIWNTFPTTNFARADLVLGQKDFVHTASNDDNQDGSPDYKTGSTIETTPTARTFDFPYYVASNGSNLFIADVLNNRVLMWSAIPTTNFTAANRVFGQGSFTANVENDDNQDGFTDGVPSARTMYYPSGVFINGTKLFVTDNSNSRFLIYTF